MSHFSLLVLTQNKPMLDYSELDKLLEPFDENKILKPYIEYTKEEYKTKLRQDLRDYKVSRTYQEYIKDKKAYRELNANNPGHLEYLEVIFPKLVKMSNEALYKKKIKELDDDQIDKDGNILSTYNPNSKYDWYTVGGRWSGLLTTRDGKQVNEGFAKDLIFDSPLEQFYLSKRIWELIVDNEACEYTEDTELKRSIFLKNPDYYIDRYKTKENYARVSSQFSTFAVLTPDGNWNAPGQMGWFGCSSSTSEDEYLWDMNYKKYIELAKEKNLYMIVVDCHI